MTEQITTPEALDALPVGTAGVDADGRPFVITVGGKGIVGVAYLTGPHVGLIGARRNLTLPVVVHHTRDTTAPSTEDREAIVQDVMFRLVESGLSWNEATARVQTLAVRQPAPSAEEVDECDTWLAARERYPSAEDREALVSEVYRILRTSDRDGRVLVREIVDAILAARQPAPVDRSKAVVNRFEPPEGWFTFGTHAGPGPVPPMEFYGVDPEDGMPLWERPAPVDAETTTTTEWGVRWRDGEEPIEFGADEMRAREHASHAAVCTDGSALVSRKVTATPWREVSRG